MNNVTVVKSNIEDKVNIEFIIVFVTTKTEVINIVPNIIDKLIDDEIIWFAFPKGSSKKYKNLEISRDHGWEILRQYGFDTVKAVAIDDNWSALRFRRVEYIKR